jgi:hypothetical protein
MRELLELNLLFALVLLCVGWMAVGRIRRDLARLQCELTGHWAAEFKRKYQEEARCPRCGEIVRVRPIESEGDGMQSGEDTIHQRLSHIEEALGIEK